MFTLPDRLDLGSPKNRYTQNLRAIRLLRRLESDSTQPTPDEQMDLAHYSGWGASAVLDFARETVSRGSWGSYHTGKPVPELGDLLKPGDWEAILDSAPNAHYTDLDVIRAIWEGIRQTGVLKPGSRILEPSCGVGHFLGACPEDLRKNFHATLIELDQVTARIAAACYPEATVKQADFSSCFRDRNGKRDGTLFDLCISNVPFGKIQMSDPGMRLRAQKSAIHNYFISRMLELTRPGGLCVAITSRYTLDGRVAANTCRKLWQTQADLIMSVRLPDNTFRANAGTDVVTDVLFFRRRRQDETALPAPWLDTEVISVTPYHQWQDSCYVVRNRWYSTHPQYLLGVETDSAKMYHSRRAEGHTWDNRADALLDVESRGNRAELPEISRQRHTEQSLGKSYNLEPFPESAPVSELMVRAFQDIQPFPMLESLTVEHISTDIVTSRECVEYSPTTQEQTQLYALYRAAKAVIRLQVERCEDDTLAVAQEELKRCRAAFPHKIHGKEAKKALASSPELLSFLLATERPDGTLEGIYTRRTIYPEAAPELCTDPVDALYRCLDSVGRLSLPWIAATCGQTEEQVELALEQHIYRDPELDCYVLKDEYLSGNVRKKLKIARALALVRNIDALEAVQPEDLQPSEISIRLQAPWMPRDVLVEWIATIAEVDVSRVQVSLVCGSWVLESCPVYYHADVPKTERMSFPELLTHALSGSSPRVWDSEQDINGRDKRVLNAEQTALAEMRVQEMQDSYSKFVWATPERTRTVLDAYNDEMNCVTMRKWDGSFLSFPGMNSDVELRDFQRNGVAQCLLWDKNNHPLFAWMTGAGKTFGAIAAIEKRLQLGLAKKVVVCVPKHLIAQWADDYRLLFPMRADQILCASKESLTPAQRGTFLSQAVVSRCRVVILSHTQLKAIPVQEQTFKDAIKEQRDQLMAAVSDAEQESKMSGEKRASPKLKRLRVMLKNLEAKIRSVEESTKKDNANIVTWEELGIDMFVGDEAHVWKNLMLTSQSEAAGLPTGCQISQDFFVKSRHVQNKGGQLLLLTATPIANTLAEAYVFATYLQPKELKARELDNTDAFLSSFTSPYMSVELDPSCSTYRTVVRLEWSNTGELVKLLHQSWHYVGEKQIGIKLPTLHTGQEIIVETEGSEDLHAYIQDLAERSVRIKSGQVEPAIDNMLKICSDGRWASLVNGPPDGKIRNTKLDEVVKNTHKIWQEYASDRAAQIIFCDLGTPSGRASKPVKHVVDDGEDGQDLQEVLTETGRIEQRKVYAYIRQGLLNNGIPASEIAFLQDHQKDPEKLRKLFADVNSGRVRVLLGSAPTGMNIQERLIALHHVDPVWRPDWKTQRDGRIVRQGNMFEQVYIYLYLTAGSFDAYMWGLVRAKLRVIDQIVSGDASVRRADGDVGDIVLRASEIQAIASGNPAVLKIVGLQNELQKLLALRREFAREQERNRMSLEECPGYIRRARNAIAAMTVMSTTAKDARDAAEGKFRAVVHNVEYTDPDLAGKALLSGMDSVREYCGNFRGLTIGRYLYGKAPTIWLEHGGIRLQAHWNSASGIWLSLGSELRDLPNKIMHEQRYIARQEAEVARASAVYGQKWSLEPEYARKLQTYQSMAESLRGTGFKAQYFPESDIILPDAPAPQPVRVLCQRWMSTGEPDTGDVIQLSMFGTLR